MASPSSVQRQAEIVLKLEVELAKAQTEFQALKGMLLKPDEPGFTPWATSYVAQHLEETRILVVGIGMDLGLAKAKLEAMVADLNS